MSIILTVKVEKIIDFFRVLLELQSNDDPVWKYFDSHHAHIMSSMTKAYQSSVRLVDGE